MLQQRWSTKLLGYDYDVKYRRGIENRAADALSRLYEEKGQFNVIILVKPQWLQELIASYGNDPVVGELKQQLTADPKCKLHYSLINGVLGTRTNCMWIIMKLLKPKFWICCIHPRKEGTRAT